MADYKIAKVSTKEPRSWSFADKKTGGQVQMLTYKVLLEGDDEPIDLNKKPGSPPQAGDILSGFIENTDFGRKFKPAPKQNPTFSRDQGSIKAQWAIGQAYSKQVTPPASDKEWQEVENHATKLFAMVDRVKGSQPVTANKPVSTNNIQNSPEYSIPDDLGGEKISLEDIPF